MSFNQKTNGRGYAPGFFLAFEECKRETCEISASHSQAVTIGATKIVPAGAVIPSNDGNAKGILFEDVEVTTGNMPGSIVTEGVVYEDRLPAAIESTAEAVLPGIRVITAAPAAARPASFTKDTLTALTVSSSAGSASGKTNLSFSGYTPGTGDRTVYKIDAEVAPVAALGQILPIGSGEDDWTAATFPVTAVTASSSSKVTVAVVDYTDAVIAAGSATVVSND